MASDLPLLPRFAEKFIQNFAAKRQPVASHETTVDRHRLYILPTRHGLMFFLILLLILLGAINYENSLGFMLSFLLGSLGFLGMIYTHQNINRLTVSIGRADSVFAGQEILFPITVKRSDSNPHPNLQILSDNGSPVHVHIIDTDTIECKLTQVAQHRGYTQPGRIKLFTEYPLGLFHAWSWLNLQSRCLVYPAPDPHHYVLHFAGDSSIGNNADDKSGVDDFSGIREYQSGDSPKHMAWKSIAKTGVLQTKLFNNETAHEIAISWSDTQETLELEQRLSILCRMVLDASEQSLKFALNIPGINIAAANGLQHKHQCLKALALFGKTE